MNNQDEYVVKNKKKHSPLTIFMIFFLVTAFLVVTVHGWFYYMRKTMAVYEISNPTSLYISAARQEDINYIDLSGIDVSDDKHYKDFVLAISGLNVSSYKIQLAYTTNNQFTFELYNAQGPIEVIGDVPENAVTYTTHGATPTEYYYYIANGASAIVGDFKNKDTESAEIEAIKIDTNKYYRRTYGDDENDTTPYTQVNKYAMPLYWQTRNTETGQASGVFTNSYILRVRWSSNRVNDKETDIIYIAAKTIE